MIIRRQNKRHNNSAGAYGNFNPLLKGWICLCSLNCSCKRFWWLLPNSDLEILFDQLGGGPPGEPTVCLSDRGYVPTAIRTGAH